MMKVFESNQKLIFWIGTTATALFIGIGMPLYNDIQTKFDNQQVQIEENRNKIWEQQRVSVTEESLSRRIADIMQIVDTKIGSIQDMQREQSRQLELLIRSQSEFQRDVRDTLREKADKD